MSAAELALRIGNTESSVVRFERSEREGRARMDTLQRAATALDCDLVYALVPRRPLEQMVNDRASKKAQLLMQPVAHLMLLEDQGVTPQVASEQLEDLARDLRGQPGLWRDDLS